MKVFMSFFSTMTAMSSAFFNHDFTQLGKASGEFAFAIFGNDQLANELEAEANSEIAALQEVNRQRLETFDEINND